MLDPRESFSEHVEPYGSGRAYLVCLTAATFFFFVFIQMNCWNTLGSHFRHLFGLSEAGSANLVQAYFYGNVLCLFPAGLLLDRFSTRVVLLLVMSISVCATAVFTFSHTLWQVQLARFVVGCSGAFCLLIPVRLVSRWFQPEKIALLVGFVVTFAMLGGTVAQEPLHALISAVGYHVAMFAYIVFGMLCIFFIYLFVYDCPVGHDIDTGAHAALETMGFWSSVAIVLKNKQDWLAGLYASLINLPVFWLGGFKGVDYLQQVDVLSKSQAGSVVGLLFIGLIVGSPLFGYYSDRIKSRKVPMVVGALASIATLLVIMSGGLTDEFALAILFFVLGVAVSSQVIAYPLVVESNSLNLTGTAEGVASILIMMGGFTTSVMLFFLGVGKTSHYENIFSVIGWDTALMVLVVCFFVALFLSLMIKETACKHCGD